MELALGVVSPGRVAHIPQAGEGWDAAMTDLSDLMAEMTRFFLAFLLGMATGPLFYVLHMRRMRR